ncbi:antigen 332, putative [hydrothermal vent metagenome]|uniref:Antigen 332, putative n=1 Tax=hydrothermal vent metagenome TaxID=652676 RepID=A0A1W1CVQ0_9ZZZZ
MYYLLNETNHIIAADADFLNLFDTTDINELTSKIAREEIELDFLQESELLLQNHNHTEVFSLKKTSLLSLIGKLTLVTLQEQKSQKPLSTEEENDDETIQIDTLLESEEVSEKEESLETLPLLEESEEILSLEEPALEEESSEKIEDIFDEDALFTIDLDETTSEETHTVTTEDTLKIQEENPDDILLPEAGLSMEITEITVDIEKASNAIGISTEDYTNFLNEFIDTALGLEKDLQQDDETTKENAVETLLQLSHVLHLPQIGEIIQKIEKSHGEEQQTLVKSFYGMLSHLTIQKESSKTETVNPDNQEEEKVELFDIQEKDTTIENTEPVKTKNENSFGTISLEDIHPIHFDFQLEEAANDLSLPVELIEEFVHDFIDQAHTETQKMLKAYEEGNLDAIQKIGHLLKGASSNLRINPLADTLYKIQFCEDPNNLELLIKDYWAHFLSLENQINVISN